MNKSCQDEWSEDLFLHCTTHQSMILLHLNVYHRDRYERFSLSCMLGHTTHVHPLTTIFHDLTARLLHYFPIWLSLYKLRFHPSTANMFHFMAASRILALALALLFGVVACSAARTLLTEKAAGYSAGHGTGSGWAYGAKGSFGGAYSDSYGGGGEHGVGYSSSGSFGGSYGVEDGGSHGTIGGHGEIYGGGSTFYGGGGEHGGGYGGGASGYGEGRDHSFQYGYGSGGEHGGGSNYGHNYGDGQGVSGGYSGAGGGHGGNYGASGEHTLGCSGGSGGSSGGAGSYGGSGGGGGGGGYAP